MDQLEQPQDSTPPNQGEGFSYSPYSHVEAYRYLTEAGLKSIRPPRLVDDTILDR